MRQRRIYIPVLIALIGALLITPVSTFAQTPPSGGEQPYKQEWLQYYSDVAKWESQNFLQNLDIFQNGYQQVGDSIRALLALDKEGKVSAFTIKFPDLSTPRTQIATLTDAVVSATDVKQSAEAFKRLQSYIKDYHLGTEDRANSIKQQLDTLSTVLKDYVKYLADKEKERLKSQAATLLKNQLDGLITNKAPQAQIQQQMAASKAQKTAEIQARMKTFVDSHTQPLKDQMNKLYVAS